MDGFITLGEYIVLIDPIDGSSNIEVKVSIATVFAMYRKLSPIGTYYTNATRWLF